MEGIVNDSQISVKLRLDSPGVIVVVKKNERPYQLNNLSCKALLFNSYLKQIIIIIKLYSEDKVLKINTK